MSGTPLFVSYNPKLQDETAFADLAEAFAHSAKQTDEFVPLDWMENTCPEKWLLNGELIEFNWIG